MIKTKDESAELVFKMRGRQLNNEEMLVITLRAGGMRWEKIAELLNVQRAQVNRLYQSAKNKLTD